jgi:glutamyl-tRNA reductase
MYQTNASNISNFYVAGISYKKIEAETRGQFAISNDQYLSLFNHAGEFDIHEFFVLSTCNRTEIYGFADEAEQLVNLLCSETAGNADNFLDTAYIKCGEDAIKHLFAVGAGLDSQILGDYEIIGQIKSAVRISKENGCIGAFVERLVNAVLQSSKAIKNQTALSGGTVSVSFAAVQYIRDHVADISDKKILLIGTGKIGRSTCKNLVDYLNTNNITLINRTPDKAKELANELRVNHAGTDQLEQLVRESDIILVATNAEEPVVFANYFSETDHKLLIDLSVPFNVEKSAALLPHIQLINVDELSKLKDETLARRQAEVPKAMRILSEYITEFLDWYEMRKNVPVLKAVKTKLLELHSHQLYLQLYPLPAAQKMYTEERIQRIINGMASKLRVQNQRGCHYIEAINEYIATGSD